MLNQTNRLYAAAGAFATWALVGGLGGAFAGLGDAAFAAARLWDQIDGFRRVELLALGAALGSGAGVLLAVLAGLASSIAQASGTTGRRWGHALWPPVLAAPVLWYAAFAVFSGPQAQRVPGHQLVSVALLVAGLVTCGALGLVVARWLGGRMGFRYVMAAATGVFVLVLCWSNGRILPRLYPWFHQALSALSLAGALVAARMLVFRRPNLRIGLGTLVLVLVPGAMAYRALTTSRQVRFALFDKTAALGTYARFLPLPQPKRFSPRALAKPMGPGLTASALPEGPKRPGADVVLITIDALRPDHMGAYGYQRPTTPRLDALAAQSTRFERAYTQAPHTSFATTSMLTGKYYPTLLRLRSGEGGEPVTSVLRRYGWRTAAFYPPAVFFVDGEKLAMFRDSAFQFEYVKVEFLAAALRVEQIKEYFETVKPERAFLWVHFFEPHEPYEAHEGHDFGAMGKANDKDRYDSEIAYTDQAVGQLLAYLKDSRPNAIVIVSADHGEEFDEHGGRYHGTSLYDEQVRVPLLIHVPGARPRVVGGQVELVDVAPTMLSLLEIPLPARMKGTDLGPWLSDQGAPETLMPPAFAEVEDKRMIVADRHKLICARNATLCQLFDLAADPNEKHDLIDVQPQRAEALHALMETWLDEQGRLEMLTPSPTEGALPKAIQQGRLGEVQAAAGLCDLVVGAPSSDFGEEAARLLATLPPQPALAARVTELADAGAVKSSRASAWMRVAAYAAAGSGHYEVAAISRRTDAPELALRAALALAERGQVDGEAVLIGSLRACNGTPLCRRAIAALGALRSRAALPALHETMADVNARLDVVQALGQLQDPRSLPVLVQALRHDERVPVRAEAAKVLSRYPQARYPQIRAALRQAARSEREPPVSAAIAKALRGRAGP